MSDFVTDVLSSKKLQYLDFFSLFDRQSQSLKNLEQNCTSDIV